MIIMNDAFDYLGTRDRTSSQRTLPIILMCVVLIKQRIIRSNDSAEMLELGS